MSGFAEQVWLGLVSGVVLTVFSTGLVLLFGIMRVVNMAHGALYMLGAMLTAIMVSESKLPFGLAAILSIATVGVGGVLLNRLALRPMEKGRVPRQSGTTSVVLLETMVLSFVLYNGAVLVFGPSTRAAPTGLTGTLDVLGAAVTAEQFILVLAGVASVAALHQFFAKTSIGKSMRAASDSAVGASLVGVDIHRMYDYAWFLAASLAALAGVLIAPLSSAGPTIGQDTLIKGFAVVVAAGLTSFSGVIVTALGLGLLGALFGQFVSTYYQDVFIFAVMVVVLLVKPTGLFRGNTDSALV